MKKKRFSFTPGKELLTVNPKWQRRFAEEAAELMILEGRYTEIMRRISELTEVDLKAKEPIVVKVEKATKKKMTTEELNKTATPTPEDHIPVPVTHYGKTVKDNSEKQTVLF